MVIFDTDSHSSLLMCRNIQRIPNSNRHTGNGNVDVDSVATVRNPTSIRDGKTDVLTTPPFRGMSPADAARLLIHAQGAALPDKDGDRPLHLAVVHEDVVLVRQLCGLYRYIGMPVDIYNDMWQTPLHLAVLTGNSNIIEVLLEEGASIDLSDRNGNTAVHLAVKEFKEECLRPLLRHCLYYDALGILNNEGYTPLHLAVLNCNKRAVELLANARCFINAQDGKGGRTALLYTVLTKQEKIMQLLLDNGASTNTTDYSGNSPVSILSETKNKYFMALMEKNTLVMKTYQSPAGVKS